MIGGVRAGVRMFLLMLEPRTMEDRQRGKAGISFDAIALYFEAEFISDESPPFLTFAVDITFKHSEVPHSA